MIHCFGRAALGGNEGPLTREQFVSLVFDPLDGQGVDAVLFSFGNGNVAEYQSNVLEWPGAADRFTFPQSHVWHGGIKVDPADQYRNPKALAESGANPPGVIVEECHRRGIDAFVSLRMNDCHDGQHPRGSLPNPELATFKRQNPDWLVEDLDWWTALNFSHPRVQRLKLEVIQEFFDRWDFDGIELDWLRHTLYFPRGTEPDNAHHLTQFMRQVRKMLNERADRRGRPIEIAVRVPERVSWCIDGGFDVPTWIAEDLVDILILGQGTTTLPTLDEFRELMGDRTLPIYPCVASTGNGYPSSPDQVLRGSAANLWHDGADGLYTFNWFVYGNWRSQLLSEIADPQQLAGRDKTYTLLHKVEASPRDPGGDYVRYNSQSRSAPLPFYLTEVEGPRALPLRIGADVASGSDRPKGAELHLAFDFLGEQDQIEVILNGQQLESTSGDQQIKLETIGQPINIEHGMGILGFPQRESIDATFKGMRVDVPPELIRSGDNQLSLNLLRRTPGLEYDLRVTRVELATTY